MPTPEITLVISRNDHEAHAIVKLAQEHANVRIVDLNLGWGACPDSALMRQPVAKLGDVVILVECPSPAYEQAILSSGRVLHVVDHHLRCGADGVLIDRRSTKSSLEQVAQLLGIAPLNPENRRIAANDAGYWPGLFYEIASCKLLDANEFCAEALEIRKRDIGVALAAADGEFREASERDLKRAGEALDAARAWLEDALQQGNAAIIHPQARNRGPEHRAFYIISVPDNCDHRKRLCDAVYLDRLGQVQGLLKPEHFDIDICVIGTGDNEHCGRPVSMFLSGSGQLGDELEDLVNLARDHPDSGGVQLYAGAGSQAAFFGIEGERDIGRIVDTILAELVQGSRTLDRYSTQFVQALRVKDCSWICPAIQECLEEVPPNSRTLAYFNPQIRDRLTSDNRASASNCDFSIRTYEVPHLANSEFEVRWGASSVAEKDDLRPTTLVPVNRVRLHLAPERLVFVEWVIGGTTAPSEFELASSEGEARSDGISAGEPTIPFWQTLLAAHRQAGDPSSRGRNLRQITTLGDLLDVNDALRIVASAYFNPDNLRTIKLTVGENSRQLDFGSAVDSDLDTPVGWFSLLLEEALNQIGLGVADVEIRFDARARTVHSTALTGPRPKTPAGIRREDTMLSRLTGVDGFAPVTYYDQAFNDTELERWRYRRFADSGTHYAVSGFSFAMLGYGWFPANVITERDWFDLNTNQPGLAPVGHVQAIYFTMFLITQIHLAIFDALAQEHGFAIMRRQGELDGPDAALPSMAAIRGLRRRLTDYLASMWFDDLSPEMQGQDIYRKMLDHSGARQSFERLRMAIADADAVEADRQEELAEKHRQALLEATRGQEIVAKRQEKMANQQRDSFALLAMFIATPIGLVTLFTPTLMLFHESRLKARVLETADGLRLETLETVTWFEFWGQMYTTGSVYAVAASLVLFVTLGTVFLRERVTLVRESAAEGGPPVRKRDVVKSLWRHLIGFIAPSGRQGS